MGLLYRNGYVRQHIDASGVQLAIIRTICRPCDRAGDAPGGEPIEVTVPVAGQNCVVRVWRTLVGRVSLYLLDTDVEANRKA